MVNHSISVHCLFRVFPVFTKFHKMLKARRLSRIVETKSSSLFRSIFLPHEWTKSFKNLINAGNFIVALPFSWVPGWRISQYTSGRLKSVEKTWRIIFITFFISCSTLDLFYRGHYSIYCDYSSMENKEIMETNLDLISRLGCTILSWDIFQRRDKHVAFVNHLLISYERFGMKCVITKINEILLKLH